MSSVAPEKMSCPSRMMLTLWAKLYTSSILWVMKRMAIPSAAWRSSTGTMRERAGGVSFSRASSRTSRTGRAWICFRMSTTALSERLRLRSRAEGAMSKPWLSRNSAAARLTRRGDVQEKLFTVLSLANSVSATVKLSFRLRCW